MRITKDEGTDPPEVRLAKRILLESAFNVHYFNDTADRVARSRGYRDAQEEALVFFESEWARYLVFIAYPNRNAERYIRDVLHCGPDEEDCTPEIDSPQLVLVSGEEVIGIVG